MTGTYDDVSRHALRAYDYMANPKISLEEKRKRFDAYNKAFEPIQSWFSRNSGKDSNDFTEWFIRKCDEIDRKYRMEDKT